MFDEIGSNDRIFANQMMIGDIMDNFIEKFWEVINEEYYYRDMLTFEEIQKIFDHIKE